MITPKNRHKLDSRKRSDWNSCRSSDYSSFRICLRKSKSQNQLIFRILNRFGLPRFVTTLLIDENHTKEFAMFFIYCTVPVARRTDVRIFILFSLSIFLYQKNQQTSKSGSKQTSNLIARSFLTFYAIHQLICFRKLLWWQKLTLTRSYVQVIYQNTVSYSYKNRQILAAFKSDLRRACCFVRWSEIICNIWNLGKINLTLWTDDLPIFLNFFLSKIPSKLLPICGKCFRPNPFPLKQLWFFTFPP